MVRAIGILTALLQFQANQLTVLGVILFILLSSEFFIPLRLLGSFFHVAMNGKAASDKIFTLLDTPVETLLISGRFCSEKCNSSGYPRSAFCLQRRETSNYRFRFKHLTKSALRYLWVKVVVVNQPLVSLLMGFNRSATRQNSYSTVKNSRVDRHSFYEKVSLVSHSSYVFKGTLRENMKMAKVDATDEQIYACLGTSQFGAIRSR